MYWLPYSSHTSHHPSQTPLASLNLLCYSKTDAQFMQGSPKVVWNIQYVSVAFFPSLKQNFIIYRSSKVSDFIFEIHQLFKSGFSRVYSSSCCKCSFEPEIIRIGQSSQKMYSNNILNFQESTIILNAYTKKSGNLLKAPRIYKWVILYIYILYSWYCIYILWVILYIIYITNEYNIINIFMLYKI